MTPEEVTASRQRSALATEARYARIVEREAEKTRLADELDLECEAVKKDAPAK